MGYPQVDDGCILFVMVTRKADAKTNEQVAKMNYDRSIASSKLLIEAAVLEYGQIGFTVDLFYGSDDISQKAFNAIVQEYRAAGWRVEYSPYPDDYGRINVIFS